MDVVIVGNFGTSASTITPGWTSLGKWYEFYSQSEIEIDNDNSTINLAAGEYRLFSTQKKLKNRSGLTPTLTNKMSTLIKYFWFTPQPIKWRIPFQLKPR